MLKKIKIFFDKYKTAFLCLGVLLTSCLGVTFSFLYGTSNPSVLLHANLMVIDSKLKEQDINFIHGYYKLNDSMSEADKYNENLKLQYKTIYRYFYYNSYLMATNSKGIINYDTTLYKYSTKTELCSLGDFTVAMVRNYYDFEYMESIGLPLYYHANKGNRISSNKTGVNFGSYISATQAYNIAVYVGLIEDGEKDVKKIKDAFDAIVAEDNDLYMKLVGDPYEVTYCIRNIYIDKAFDFLLTEDQKSLSPRHFGDYYKSFVYWNGNTIFTHAENIFRYGSTLYFDIRESFNNINIFIDQVLGKHYSLDGSCIHFQTQKENLEFYSKNIDEACKQTGSGKAVYLILAVVFFEALLVVQISLISEKSKKKWFRILRIFLPALPYLVFCLIISFMLLSPNSLYFVYFNFNYLGNTVILIFLAVIIACEFVWGLFDDKDKKII